MSNKFINWPQNQRTMTAISDGFENFRGMKGCIGAIDGTHIPIKAPHHCGENYVNRKGFHSIVMQSVVDHQFKFLDCYIGWPGSVHDARIFNNSDILQNILNNPLDMFPENHYMIGDSAYTLTSYMLTPYKENGYLTEKQKHYNYIQAVTRNIVERTFALFKGRFPRMKYVEVNNVKEISDIVLSTCVIHNYIIDMEGAATEEIEFAEELEINNYICIGSARADAERKRAKIADDLFKKQ